MFESSNLGFPRIGFQRETKNALEKYWKGEISEQTLLEKTASIRQQNWAIQAEHGMDSIPSNDFSLYDHVLDTICMLGAIPPRYQQIAAHFNLSIYFAMARGKQNTDLDIPAMEMTKWFNTNYHHIVPEIEPTTRFSFTYSKVLDEYREAKAAGYETRPVLLGPLTFLLLSKTHTAKFQPLSRLDDLLPVYQAILAALYDAGAEWVQMDEPMLVKDLTPDVRAAYHSAYQLLGASAHRPNILLAGYFDSLGDNSDLAFSLPVEGIHLDMVSGEDQWHLLKSHSIPLKILSLGVIDGHNIWRADLENILSKIHNLPASLSANVQIAPSCSLLHVPQDLTLEDKINQPVRNWLAFAVQKLDELSALTSAANTHQKSDLFAENNAALQERETYIRNKRAHHSIQTPQPLTAGRSHPFSIRKDKQQQVLDLPLLPTTTIGSFPQTSDVRQMRSRFTKGEINQQDYDAFLRQKIEEVIHLQEQIGLDVLVHGEFERNDMVQYFAEQLEGFIFTKHGWVQSFGSRYVRPPIIFGDVERPHPMTVDWIRYAQSLTSKPVKGMLTGPVTILQWSFVRDDQPRSQTCFQIAHAIQKEVHDLEQAGIKVIQIDEPALREGLPLKKKEWQAYLDWAVHAFHITTSGCRDETQIHTHMCYSEFNEIIASIAALDADVISIEAARSDMELLKAFSDFHYPNEIGPGVYDIHSPRIPSTGELEDLIKKALTVLPANQVWVNPDCGLKTRGWQETLPSLKNMVAAAQNVRDKIEMRK
ncbi:MAG: 5-methyltetrahydropteroyltriglutamate--homocysteine methyltransferase [Anaerolinea thermophila]|uniref:5-methyltetrahydropteroyltriglutamate--homocysteine methyltransferase n=1 Tax=Anaerolinea thermophila TaxID=167964 RepID=A0A101FYW7_9CHLR|nr:MAG: 5-methyltetrahydropteroyltriglutamate--homocysteine methyltransferase [Anaerolinea thermophila]